MTTDDVGIWCFVVAWLLWPAAYLAAEAYWWLLCKVYLRKRDR